MGRLWMLRVVVVRGNHKGVEYCRVDFLSIQDWIGQVGWAQWAEIPQLPTLVFGLHSSIVWVIL